MYLSTPFLYITLGTIYDMLYSINRVIFRKIGQCKIYVAFCKLFLHASFDMNIFANVAIKVLCNLLLLSLTCLENLSLYFLQSQFQIIKHLRKTVKKFRVRPLWNRSTNKRSLAHHSTPFFYSVKSWASKLHKSASQVLNTRKSQFREIFS